MTGLAAGWYTWMGSMTIAGSNGNENGEDERIQFIINLLYLLFYLWKNKIKMFSGQVSLHQRWLSISLFLPILSYLLYHFHSETNILHVALSSNLSISD